MHSRMVDSLFKEGVTKVTVGRRFFIEMINAIIIYILISIDEK